MKVDCPAVAMLEGYLMTFLEYPYVYSSDQILERYWSDWQPWEFDINSEELNHSIRISDYYPNDKTLIAGLEQAVRDLHEWVVQHPEDKELVNYYLEPYKASLVEARLGVE